MGNSEHIFALALGVESPWKIKETILNHWCYALES